MKIIIPSLVTILSLTIPAQATILLSDGFESGTTNWTLSNPAAMYTVETFSSEGVKSLLLLGGSTRTVTSASSFSLAAGGDLLISFDYKAGNTNPFESTDGLAGFDINLGSGFNTVVTDFGFPNGLNDTYTGTPFVLPTTAGGISGFVNYSITIPETYYSSLSASTVSLRFRVLAGAGDEWAYLDNVNVSLVPEPSTFLLVAMSLGALLLLRRPSRLRRS